MLQLIDKSKNSYKAALHVHTTVSDGKMTPEEVKQAYRNEGYSVVAFTDHQVFVPHNDLTEEGFLAINSVEYALNYTPHELGGWPFIHTYHLNMYAKSPDTDFTSLISPVTVWLKQSLPYISEEMQQNTYVPEYSIAGFNEWISRANDEGFLVCYNHPLGNRHSYPDYAGLKGLWGVEWFNYGSNRSGMIETIGPMDDLLHNGQQVFPIAGDDSHELNGCFGGFCMIQANELSYASILDAMEKGDFYSSTGPLFESVILDGTKLTVETSGVRDVFVTTERRVQYPKSSKEKPITEAVFDLADYIEQSHLSEEIWNQAWFRITLYDFSGKEAHTRAYFLKELFPNEEKNK